MQQQKSHSCPGKRMQALILNSNLQDHMNAWAKLTYGRFWQKIVIPTAFFSIPCSLQYCLPPLTFAIFVIWPQLVTRLTWTTVATNGIHTDLLASAIVGFTLVRLWKITYYIIIIVILALRACSMTHIPCSAPAGKMNQSLMEWWRIISRFIRGQS